MREWFKNNVLPHKKRYIIIIIILLILLVFGAIALFSHAFYQKESKQLIISGTASIDGTDIRLRIYLQQVSDGVPLDSYVESPNAAVSTEYIFNPGKSSCSEGEYFESINNNELSINYGQKGSCSAYYDYIGKDYDVISKIFIETGPGTHTYQYVDSVDNTQYTLNKSLSECISLDGTITVPEVREDGKIAFAGKGVCELVYNKNA